MKFTIPLAACASLALAACGAPADQTADDPASGARDAAMAAQPGATPAPADDPAPGPDATDAGETDSIPVALRGRWGVTPEDCTEDRGDEKTLIKVSAEQVKFYESVATLGAVKEREPDSIRASWNFTGEGMTWSRDMALSASGDSLVRREYGADAMAEPLTYTRCG